MALFYKEMESPVGKLKLVAGVRALVAILWEHERGPEDSDDAKLEPRHPILVQAERQLNEYFAGVRKQFDVPLEPRGSEFQKKVWLALTKIPYGGTWSYFDLAAAIGSPKACRAVGAANGKNPMPIIIPCHRVIGKNGTLTGFGGGLDRKATLLALEKAAQSPELPGVSPVSRSARAAPDFRAG